MLNYDELIKRIENNDLTLTELELWGDPEGYGSNDKNEISLTDYEEKDIAGLLYKIAENKKITKLTLSELDFQGDIVKALKFLLQSNKTMKTLTFRDCNINDRVLNSITEEVKRDSLVQCLQFIDNPITSEGAKSLVTLIKKCCHLRSLEVSYSYLGDRGAIILAEALRGDIKLKTLSLMGNGIGYLGIKKFAYILRNHNNMLARLDLSNNRISCYSAFDLSEMILNNKSLESLSIVCNTIEEDGKKALEIAVSDNKYLKRLLINSYNINEIKRPKGTNLDKELEINREMKPTARFSHFRQQSLNNLIKGLKKLSKIFNREKVAINNEQNIINDERIQKLYSNKVQKDLREISEYSTTSLHPAEIEGLIKYIYLGDTEIATQAATIIRQQILSCKSFQDLENSLKYIHPFQNHSFTYKDLEMFKSLDANLAAHLVGMVSLNHNGYARQKAIKYLSEINSRECLPYILVRLNDWVMEVRDEARRVFQNYYHNIDIKDIIEKFDLIDKIKRGNRINHSYILEPIKTLIRAFKDKETLLSIIRKAPFKARYFFWQILLEQPTEALVDIALKDPLPEIRELAARKVSNNFRLKILLKEKSVRVKNAAIKAIPEEQLEANKHIFEQGIYDSSASTRSYCRFILKKLGNNNIVELYRGRILEGNISKNILIGFAETAINSDTELLLRFIDHASAAVRSAILFALNRLSYSQVMSLLLKGIKDSSNIVRSRSVSILQKEHRFLQKNLRHILENDEYPYQKAALRVLSEYNALEALRNILFAIAQSNQELEVQGWNMLRKWLNFYRYRLWFPFNRDIFNEISELIPKIDLKVTELTSEYYSIKGLKDILSVISKASLED